MGEGAARLVARFDDWTLWRAPLELFRSDQPVKLQEQPLEILEALLLKPGELVTREALTAHLWPDSVVDFEAGLNTAVRKLRAALGDDAEAPKYVETVPRQGYRFIGPIERRDDDSAMELLGAESALMLREQARAIDEARAATRLVDDTSTPPASLHVRLMAARVLAWAGEGERELRSSKRSRAATPESARRRSRGIRSSARASPGIRGGGRWSRR
jgi:DNA-binding winged helix-turn-helix (wHTH) protein